MKKAQSIIVLAALFACLAYAAWADLTLNNTISTDPLGDIMNRINGVVCILFTLVTYVASGISAIIIIYAGLKYMTSQDAEQTTNAKNMIIYAIAGLALILLACPIVDYLIIGTKIVPFEQKCNCLGGSGSPVSPATTCGDGTPKNSCSATPGYRCILSAGVLVLSPDPSCGIVTTSSTSTTTTSTTTTSTTTTLTDHTFCYNAGEDATICAGLNVLRTGYQADCCTEWTCCCITPSGTCTPP
jgi:hypothetical protein